MILMVMRHGIAERTRTTDFERCLTQTGITGVKHSAEKLHQVPTKIIASPLVRARETANLVSDVLQIEQPIITMDELSPSGRPEIVVDKLSEISQSDTCLLVSHQPFVSIFIQYLTGRRVYLETANIAGLRLDVLGPTCGDLQWFICD